MDGLVAAVEGAGARWAQFGDELFVYSANDKWSDAASAGARRAKAHEVGRTTVSKAKLHLVVQKGRVFQKEFPDVRVVLDKGRYLVVDLDGSTARKIGARVEPCFRIEPFAENRIVFRDLPRRKPPAPDARIGEIVGLLDYGAVVSDLASLVAFGTRLSTSAEFEAAASWAEAKLAALGYATEITPVALGAGRQSANVVATKRGVGPEPAGRVLVVGHLDSVNAAGGAGAPAPGADDNASGTAGVLEIARVLAGQPYRHDLSFVLFGGEEQGLHGSQQFVAALTPEARTRILAVVNMDMIGSVNTEERSVLLEGAELSQSLIDHLAEAAAAHTTLRVQTSLRPFASDHVPFIDVGVPAVLTIEGADGANDAIHTADDTLDKVDAAFAVEILRMNTACVAQLAEPREEVTDGECGCVPCGGAQGDPAGILRKVAEHYQHLLAQYARLYAQGQLQAGDYAAWRTAQQIVDTVCGQP